MINPSIASMFFLNPVRVEYSDGQILFVYIDCIKDLIYDKDFTNITSSCPDIVAVLKEKKQQMASITVKDGAAVYKTPESLLNKIYPNLKNPLEETDARKTQD